MKVFIIDNIITDNKPKIDKEIEIKSRLLANFLVFINEYPIIKR